VFTTCLPATMVVVSLQLNTVLKLMNGASPTEVKLGANALVRFVPEKLNPGMKSFCTALGYSSGRVMPDAVRVSAFPAASIVNELCDIPKLNSFVVVGLTIHVPPPAAL